MRGFWKKVNDWLDKPVKHRRLSYLILLVLVITGVLVGLNQVGFKIFDSKIEVETEDQSTWEQADFQETKNGIRIYFLYQNEPINEEFFKSLVLGEDKLQDVRKEIERAKAKVVEYFSNPESYPSEKIPPGKILEVYFDLWDGWNMSYITLNKPE